MADGDAEIEVVEVPSDGGRPRTWWRRPAILALSVILLAVAGELVMRYRHEHTDRYYRETVAWRGVDVSEDGRTLTFHGWAAGSGAQPDGVTFSSDPTAGGSVTAVIHSRTLNYRNGHVVFSPLDLKADTPIQSVTLDQPVPQGTVITDGTVEPDFCGHLVSQTVQAPSTALRAWPTC